MKASPKQMMSIIKEIESTLWAQYKSYQTVKLYIERWQVETWANDDYPVYNFNIVYKKDDGAKNIDLLSTLNKMDDELLFKIAVDLGLDIPDMIYAVPEIISLKSSDYKDVGISFEEAYKKIYVDPSHSIALSQAALETVIKRICNDERFNQNEEHKSLYKLATCILKEFHFLPKQTDNNYIRNIGSSILNIAKNIEDLRSNCTKEAHGRLNEDYIIDDPLYAQLFVNTTATLGLFLLNFYEKKYVQQQEDNESFDLPF